MNFRLLLSISLAGIFSLTSFAQLPRIVVQGSGTPQVFTDINAAITAAQPNDKLYFSGGTFTPSLDLIVDKPLHFIGAGIHPDSTAATGTTTISTTNIGNSGLITVTTAASGSSFTGIRFAPYYYVQYGTSDADDDPVDIVFERCLFLERTFLVASSAPSGSSSTSFNECIFHGSVEGWYGVTASMTRCIFDYGFTSGSVNGFQSGFLTIDHCNFLSSLAVSNSSNALVKNSVFNGLTAQFYQCNNIQVLYCMFADTLSVAATNGNLPGVPLADIFSNEANAGYQFADDLHLTATSPGVGAADDGTDMGIYGSSSPYKPGAVPYNPHFRAASIAPSTEANGDLPVNIHVAAQPN